MAELPTAEDVLGPRPKNLPTAEDVLGPRPEPKTPPSMGGSLNDSFFSSHGNVIGRAMSAFGTGYDDAWGFSHYNLEEGTQNAMKAAGIYNDSNEAHKTTVKALNEAIMRPTIGAVFDWGINPAIGTIGGLMGLGQMAAQDLATGARASAEYEQQHPIVKAFDPFSQAMGLLGQDTNTLSTTMAGGLGEITGAVASGQYVGDLPGPGVLREPVEGPRVEPSMGSFTPPKPPERPFRTFADLPDPITEARSVDAIGTSKEVYLGTAEPTEKEVLARAKATGNLREAPPVAPDVGFLARQIAPDAFYEHDIVQNKRNLLLDAVKVARQARDNSPVVKAATKRIGELEDQLKDLTQKAAENYTSKLQKDLDKANSELNDVRGGLEAYLDTDTEEMVKAKEAHARAYQELLDTSRDVRTAYQEAQQRISGIQRTGHTLADVEEPFVEPSGGPETAPEADQVQPPSEEGIPAARAPRAPSTLIYDHTVQQLQKAGRPLEEAQAQAGIIQYLYRALAQRFKGKLGSAEHLYANEAPEVVGSTQATRAAKVFKQDDIDNVVNLSGRRDQKLAKEAIAQGAKESVEGFTPGNHQARIDAIIENADNIIKKAYDNGLVGIWKKWNELHAFVKEFGVDIFTDEKLNDNYQALLDEAKGLIARYQENISKPGENVVQLRPKTLEQPGRGSITKDVQASGVRLIKLMKNADASSFMHETAHDFLEKIKAYAAHPEAPEDLIKDWNTVKEWLGVKEDGKISEEQHELFARGFERYLMEGTAPNKALEGIFAKFKKWLTDIYKTVANLNAPISPEIRQVFDRLLTVDEPTVYAGEDTVRAMSEETRIPGEKEVPKAEELQTRTPESTSPTEPTYLQSDGSYKMESITNYADLLGALKENAEHDDFILYATKGKISDSDAIEIMEAAGLNSRRANINKLHNAFVKDEISMSARVRGLKKFFDQSAQKLRDLMAKENPSMEEAKSFIAQAALHRKVIETILGVRAEWGRTGHALKVILDEAKSERELMDVIEQNTSMTYSQALFAMRVGNATVKNTKQASKLVNAMSSPSPGQMLYQYLINNYISGPITHATYSLGNKLKIVYENAAIAPAEAAIGNIAQALHSKPIERVTWGEVGDGLYALIYGQRDGFRAYKAAMKSGQQQGLQVKDIISEKVQHEIDTGILPEASRKTRIDQLQQKVDEFFSPGADKKGFTFPDIEKDAKRAREGKPEKIPGHLREIFPIIAKSEQPQSFYYRAGGSTAVRATGALGKVINAPGEKLVAPIHSIDYTVSYMTNQARLISRQARQEALQNGWDRPKMAQRMAELYNDTPLETIAEAKKQALEDTLLTKNGKWVQKLKLLLGHETDLPLLGPTPLGSFVQPFVGVVSNVWRLGFRTAMLGNPITGMMLKDIRQSALGKNGTLAQHRAFAKMAVGTAFMSTMWGLMEEGLMNDPAAENADQRTMQEAFDGMPNGIHIGDMAYAPEKLGAIGFGIAMLNDLHHFKEQWQDEGFTEAATALIYALGHELTLTSTVSGVADLFDAIENPGQYGKSYINGYLQNLIVPWSVGQGQVAAFIDPYQREVNTGNTVNTDNPSLLTSLWSEWNLLKKVFAKNSPLPYMKNEEIDESTKAAGGTPLTFTGVGDVGTMSQSLYPRIDLFGNPMPSRAFRGVYAEHIRKDPVYNAFKASSYFPKAVEKEIHGYFLSEKQYHEYAVLAGVGTKKLLDNDVNSPGFASMPEVIKHDRLAKDVALGRRIARQAIMAKYPEIPAYSVKQKKELAIGTQEQPLEDRTTSGQGLEEAATGEGPRETSDMKPMKQSEPYPSIQDALHSMSTQDFPEEQKWQELMKTGKTVDATSMRGDLYTVAQTIKALIDSKYPQDKTDSPKVAEHISKAFVASRRNWISTLGFDPSKFGFNRDESGKYTVGGEYSPEMDTGLSMLSNPESLVHESIHRGLTLLQNSGKLTDQEKRFVTLHHEDIPRYIVAKDMGDPQLNIGPLGQKQREESLTEFEKRTYSEENRKLLTSVEHKAAELFREQVKGTFPTVPKPVKKGKK